MTIARSQEALRRARFGSAVVATKIVSLDRAEAPPVQARRPRTSLIDAEWEPEAATEATGASPVAEHTATWPPPAFVARRPVALGAPPPTNDQRRPVALAAADDSKAEAGWRALGLLALAALSLCLGIGLLRSELTILQPGPSRVEHSSTTRASATGRSEPSSAAPTPTAAPMPSASPTPTTTATTKAKRPSVPAARLNRAKHAARIAPTRRATTGTDNPY